MIPSAAGLAVVAILLVAGRLLRRGMLWPLFLSVAFGSTAFATLPALGGASPLIYTLLAILVILATIARRDLSRQVRTVFVVQPACWLAVGLLIYVLAGAYILPRLFLGDALVYVVSRKSDGTSGVFIVPLLPQSMNMTQAAYMALGLLTFIAVSISLLGMRRLEDVRMALLGWVVLILASGVLDLVAGSVGLGDIFEPLRTASYAMMTADTHAVAGFKRINGLFSEAAAYASVLVPSLAFAVAYWRVTGGAFALALVLVGSALLVLSTSTTAYVTAALCGIWLALGILREMVWRLRVRAPDLVLLGFVVVAAAGGLALYIVNESFFAPMVRLLDLMVFSKSTSDSALERGAWNAQAMRAFIDTWGLGVGIGSTRTSSWAVAVISHLGVPGALLMLAMVLLMLRGQAGLDLRRAPRHIVALAHGCRAAGLATLVAACVSAPSADPGIMFFLLLAGVLACRHHFSLAGYHRRRARRSHSWQPATAGAAMGGLRPTAPR